MKRRGFLGLLGLIPFIPTFVKEAMAVPPELVASASGFEDTTVEWWAKSNRPAIGTNDFTLEMVPNDGQWHNYLIIRENGIDRHYVDAVFKCARKANGDLLETIREHYGDIVAQGFNGHLDSLRVMRGVPTTKPGLPHPDSHIQGFVKESTLYFNQSTERAIAVPAIEKTNWK